MSRPIMLGIVGDSGSGKTTITRGIVRVHLDPPEELRRHWKVQRDCSRRGYTTDQVLAELDRREPDSEAFIRPQRHHADVVVAFQPGTPENQEHLDCKLTLRDTLPHPDLTDVVGN